MLSLYHDKLQLEYLVRTLSHHHYTLGLSRSAHNYTLWQQHPSHETGQKLYPKENVEHWWGKKDMENSVTWKGLCYIKPFCTGGDQGYMGQDAHVIQQDWGIPNGGV